MTGELDNLLIHIGYHKTGSTWLQRELFTSDNEVFEPLSKNAKGQSTLSRHFIKDDEGHVLSPFDFNRENIEENLKSILDGNHALGEKLPVFSHERLSGNPHSGGFDSAKIAGMLHSTFPHARILIVTREQRSFLLSNYFQYLTLGGSYKLSKYLDTPYDGRRPYFSPAHIQYYPLVSHYAQKFGRDKVLVLPYELFQARPREYMDRLQDFLNVKIHVPQEKFATFANRKEHQFLMYHGRCLGSFRAQTSINNYSMLSNPITRPAYHFLLDTLGALIPQALNDRTKQRMKSDIDQWAIGRYESANRALGTLMDIDLTEFGYAV